MNAQERLDYLLADVWVPSQTLVTIGMLRDEIGLTAEEYTKVRTTLENAIAALKASSDPVERMKGIDLADALAGMLGKGVSLNGESRQKTIDLLATFGQWSDELKAKIKTLGGTTRKRWQTLNRQSEPTLQQVQAEIAVEEAQAAEQTRTELVKGLRTRFDAILNQIGTVEQSEAVAALEEITAELKA